jgi:hypothetical protein
VTWVCVLVIRMRFYLLKHQKPRKVAVLHTENSVLICVFVFWYVFEYAFLLLTVFGIGGFYWLNTHLSTLA